MILFVFTPVTPEDVLKVGLIPFVLSAIAFMGKVMLQAIRFKYFIDVFIDKKISFYKAISARLASEFVSQTTPAYVGGEIIRIAFLTKSGVSAGKAAWITNIEILVDVFVNSILSVIAGIIAIYYGGLLIGIIVILVSIPVFSFWFILLIYSSRKNLQLPKFIESLIIKLLKQKSSNIIHKTNAALYDLCQMSRENLSNPGIVKTFAVALLVTFGAFALQGVSFLILADTVNTHIGLFESILATASSTAIASMPITIGGSGLAELGIWGYISNLNGIPTIEDVMNDSQLNVIIAWRIATYHIPLVIMWIALMRFAVGGISSTYVIR